MAGTAAHKPEVITRQKGMNDITARTMQWRGKSTSQPTNKKGDMGQTKEEKAYTQVVSSPKKK